MSRRWRRAPWDGTTTDDRSVIERAGAGDLMQLACDVGPLPWQIGAVLVLDPGPRFDLSAATEVIGERLAAIPRLRQLLLAAPPLCGRPVWVDDPTFDVRRHVRTSVCPRPGDEAAVLYAALALLAEPLPASGPRWRARFLTGLADDRVALVVVFHHVLMDGIGGLAVLADLADGAAPVTPAPFPRPAPSRRALASDAWRARGRAAAGWRLVPPTLAAAATELNATGKVHAPRTTLNRPSGPSRRVAIARADLSRVREAAHAHGATVNDVALTAIGGALGALLTRRGESVRNLVVSVPVSAHTVAGVPDTGNRVGVMPVDVPLCADPVERLVRVAALTRAQKTAQRGASAQLLQPAFRALAAVGLLRWFVNRQRLINTVVTDLHGPDRPLTFAGAAVTDVIPLVGVYGNVTTSFAVMSYAGTLTIVVVVDGACHPDLDAFAEFLRHELDTLASAAERGPRDDGSRAPRAQSPGMRSS